MNNTAFAFSFPAKLVLIYRPRRDGRLSYVGKAWGKLNCKMTFLIIKTDYRQTHPFSSLLEIGILLFRLCFVIVWDVVLPTADKLILGIPRATRTPAGCIRHDKHHACYYCHHLVTNIWRHYHLQHGAEDEVWRINALKGKEKKLRINTLRMLGDYCHNVQVLSQKSGELIIVRRPAVNKSTPSYADFLPCVGCKGFFSRKELWRHCKTCELRKQ